MRRRRRKALSVETQQSTSSSKVPFQSQMTVRTIEHQPYQGDGRATGSGHPDHGCGARAATGFGFQR